MTVSKQIDYVRENWSTFPTNTFYPTSYVDSLIVDRDNAVFVYSLHRVGDVISNEVAIQSSCFRLFSLHIESVSEPTGFCVVPDLPEGFILRYTPFALTATNPDATYKAVKESHKAVIYNNNWFELIKLTECDVEMVTDLGHRLDIYLGD